MTDVPPLEGKACGDSCNVPVPGWHPRPGDRKGIAAALRMCERWCPVMRECREWALNGAMRPGVIGGLTLAERLAIQADRAGQARTERKRAVSRASERRRRMLGLAADQKIRYALDPEPFRKRSASYYQEHRDEILANRKARYQAARDAR